jgi:competence ComEA-like helix-hairpin-helix protein
LAASVLVADGGAAGQDKKSNLPDGPGKEQFQSLCSSCHEMAAVTAARRTKAGWKHVIDDMVDRGAEGSEEDLDAVLSYLATFYGRVNVNTASAQEMEKSLGLSVKQAEAIVAYRQHNGKIADFDQLTKIPGLDAGKIQAKRGWIAFTQ